MTIRVAMLLLLLHSAPWKLSDFVSTVGHEKGYNLLQSGRAVKCLKCKILESLAGELF